MLAAHRAGSGTVVLPRLNEDQLAALPEEVREEIGIVLADQVGGVLEVAFERQSVQAAAAGPGRDRAP